MTGHDHHRHVGRIEIGGRPVRHEYRGHAWDLTHYQEAVEAQLRLLRQSRTARVVLNSITNRLIIIPWQDPADDNAEARPVPGAFVGYLPTSLPRNNRDATMSGQWVRSGHPEDGVGAGRGSAVVLEYTPGMWVPGNPNSTPLATPTGAQEMLLHELVHAIRQMRGVADTRALANYDSRDEFHAILVTNIYRSERKITPLRRDHHGFQPLVNPSAFYTQPRNKLLVMDLCREMQAFTRALADVDCSFNPIRQHYVEMGVLRA